VAATDRRYPRIPAPHRTFLAWQTANQKEVSRLGNLSLNGLFICTLNPLPAGSFIQLLLDVPAGEVRARAVVQWMKAGAGMGVKMIAMQQEDRGRLARWIKNLTSDPVLPE
jgi:hypothetical protein